MSYNLHSGVGSDGRFDPDRQLQVLQTLDADVIGLQEVLNIATRGQSLVQDWGDALQLKTYFDPSFTRKGVPYGNALLSRFAHWDYSKHDVSVGAREPRTVLEAIIETGHESLQVINTHFGLRRFERRQQAEKIITLTQANDDSLRVVMGDFNEWHRRGRAAAMLDRHLNACPRMPTFPSRLPIFALDRIWICPRQRLQAMSVVKSPAAKRASDHLPIVADTRDRA